MSNSGAERLMQDTDSIKVCVLRDYNIFFQVYQQDATLYNILYYCQCSTCNKEYCIMLHLVGILERIP
jgi:hypothetical protein